MFALRDSACYRLLESTISISISIMAASLACSLEMPQTRQCSDTHRRPAQRVTTSTAQNTSNGRHLFRAQVSQRSEISLSSRNLAREIIAVCRECRRIQEALHKKLGGADLVRWRQWGGAGIDALPRLPDNQTHRSGDAPRLVTGPGRQVIPAQPCLIRRVLNLKTWRPSLVGSANCALSCSRHPD